MLHLCVHGMVWETVPPIRWMLDVHLLLRRHAVKWDNILAEARRRGVTLPLTEALATYESVLPGEIPHFVLEQLQHSDATTEQRVAYARIVTEPSVSTIVRGMWADWKAAQSECTASSGVGGFTRFLCKRWHVPSIWRLPEQFCLRFRRRWRSVKLFNNNCARTRAAVADAC